MSEATAIENPKPDILYSIPPEDFQTIPTATPKPYKQDDIIDRDNFASFIIKGFAVSRGKPAAHVTYFKWLQVNQGFDYLSTIRNFVDAGGWTQLSQAERNLLVDSARSGTKHDSAPTPIYSHLKNATEEQVGRTIVEQLRIPLATTLDPNVPVSPEDLQGMPFAELTKRIGEWKNIPSTYFPEYTMFGTSPKR